MVFVIFFSDVEDVVRRSQGEDTIERNGLEGGENIRNNSGDLKEHSNELSSDNKKNKRVFKAPETDSNIVNMSAKKFAPRSRKKIKWAVNLYTEWRRNRIAQPGVPSAIVNANIDMINSFTQGELAFSLCRFIREVRKIDGNEYPPNSIREIIIMLQMHLHENSVYWKLLDGEHFLSVRNVVDNTMKERHTMGMGIRRSSQVISLADEGKMFNLGILGNGEATQLLKTVIYMVGLHCALRGGVEHNNLRRPGCSPQIQIQRDLRGVECLVYTEDPLQKTNQGGLACKVKPKVVNIYPATDKMRCPVYLYKKYIGLLPKKKLRCKKLYLRPRKVCRPNLWYGDQPYGINKIKNNVSDICKEAGMEGFYSNHSLRAMCASRMYNREIPEQLIKEVTGHRSDCVQQYKRTSDHLKEKASSTVSHCNDEPSTSRGVKRSKVEPVITLEEECSSEVKPPVLSVDKMMANIDKTKEEIRKRRSTVARSRLSLKHSRNSNRITIDVNSNIKK